MSDTDSGSRKKRSIRTIGINFPHSEEGNRIYNLIEELKEEEDRSYSKVVFRILLKHFKGQKPANVKTKNASVKNIFVRKQTNTANETSDVPTGDSDAESNDSIHIDDPFTTNT